MNTSLIIIIIIITTSMNAPISFHSACECNQLISLPVFRSLSPPHRNKSVARRGALLLSFLLFMAAFVINSESRSFSLLGCLGEYDITKFAELDRVCEDCFQIYREPDLNASCR